MAYAIQREDQKRFNYSLFLERVKEIEDYFSGNVSKCVSGREIYVITDGLFEQTYFEKTTISDLRAVEGDINFTCLMTGIGARSNPVMFSMKEPGKKDFRSKIKYTPPGTISVSMRCFAKNKNNQWDTCGWDKIPFLQNEKFVNEYCNNAYENDEVEVDYNYLERHAFRALTNDRRFKCSDDYVMTAIGAEQDCSQNLHIMTCNMFDIKNSWGVCYMFANNLFIFPMEREYIQEVFKRRDPENGRRRVIASIVNEFTRKNGQTVDSHLRSAEGFSIDGREFCILIGVESLNKIFPDTPKSKERLKKLYKNMEEHNTDFNTVGFKRKR